jgi:Protein of unknown function (DUF2934)
MSQYRNPMHPTEKPRSAPSDVLVDEIRCRAYELYQQRGGEDNHAVEDWLRAEEEISQNQNMANRKAA